MLSIDGLVTGIDTASVIDGILEIQQQQINRLNERKQGIVQQQAAVGVLESNLASLQSSIVQLGRTGSNAFTGRLSTVSDEDAASVAVSNSALPGSYRMTINELARAHQVASNGFDSNDDPIATGTYSLQVGDGTQVAIEITSTNNTLTGLVEAINSTDADISAAVINDGSATSGNRVLLTSRKTGAANAMTISFDQDVGSTDPAVTFDLMNPVQEATDASVQLGSGAGAIVITSETNQLDEAIPGVTLSLLKADAGNEISIDITRDSEKAVGAINDFVTAFNDFITFVNEQSKFDPETGAASVLFSNRSVDSIRDEITQVVTSSVIGADVDSNRLSAAGITIGDTGLLQVADSSKLNELASTSDGLDKLSQLFGLQGESDNGSVDFVLAGNQTQASVLDENGDLVPYNVRITRAATRARIVGGSDVQAATIDETNNTITVSIDKSTEVELTLASGAYTEAELVDHLESLIADSEELPGRSVSASLEDGKLELISDTYGGSSSIDIVSGSALGVLGLTAGQDDNGFDVAGEFVFNPGTVDEYTERAEGRGQLLSGEFDENSTIENHQTAGATQDLQLRVTLTASQVDDLNALPDNESLVGVTFTRGIASKIGQTVTSILSSSGTLARMNEAFDARIDSVDDSIERLNNAFDARRESLTAQFARLESVVGDLQGVGSLLSAQLATIPSF